MSVKEPVSRMYKELSKLNDKKTSHPMKKMSNGHNQSFKEDIKLAKKHMKRCSTSSAAREMQIKPTKISLHAY